MMMVIGFLLLFGESYFFVYLNPTCPRYTMHILHGHLSGTHLIILDVKALSV